MPASKLIVNTYLGGLNVFADVGSGNLGTLHASPRAAMTPEGGFAVRLTNKTGAVSVKGQVVRASTSTDNAFQTTPTSSDEAFGVVYEAGIADGAECWIVVAGRAQVLLENASAATRGNWVYTSGTAAGRANATLSDPPGGGIPELDTHMHELGHCLETVNAGTNKLAYCLLHFN